jgi:hypothetical protein
VLELWRAMNKKFWGLVKRELVENGLEGEEEARGLWKDATLN